jgi:ATP-dependent DNA helicase PIF1
MDNSIDFSNEQQIAFNKYIEGKNIFITGPGGTGKSLLIKEIKKHAEKNNKKIQVCALTGCAALLLNCKAKTIHSWSGISLGNNTIEQHVSKVIKNIFKKTAWKQTDILVIDEVSMMSKKILEMLDKIGKTVRKCHYKPFGGIQLIFSGDFYQLPPVGNKQEPDTMSFCFESPLWNQFFKKEDHIKLVKIFRQKEEEYSAILNEIREGRLKRSSYNKLLENVGKSLPEDSIIRPTKLFPVRSKVDAINNYEMANLASEKEITYGLKYCLDLPMTEKEKEQRGHFNAEQVKAELDYIKGNLLCESSLKLKVGAQVMSVANIEFPDGSLICNGSQGIVTKINENNIPTVKFHSGCEVLMNYHSWPSETIPGVGITQIPLILSWAITIHKSQGASLDIAEIDVGSSVFECGQTYVALSRVKSLQGLYLSSFDVNKIRINKKVQEFYEGLK